MSHRARFAALVARNAALAAGVSTSARYFVGDGLTQWHEHATQEKAHRQQPRQPPQIAAADTAHESGAAQPLLLPPSLPPPQGPAGDGGGGSSLAPPSPSWWQPLRSAVFSTFGLLYGLGPGYLWYNKVIPRLFPGFALRAAVADVLVQCPLMYFPLFYITNEAYQQGWAPTPSDLGRAPAVARDALEKYRGNFLEDERALILFWLPCHFLNFRFVPLHFRMPFMALIGFGWTAILSTMRGGDVAQATQANNELLLEAAPGRAREPGASGGEAGEAGEYEHQYQYQYAGTTSQIIACSPADEGSLVAPGSCSGSSAAPSTGSTAA